MKKEKMINHEIPETIIWAWANRKQVGSSYFVYKPSKMNKRAVKTIDDTIELFKEFLSKYSVHSQFNFSPNDSLEGVCNAPFNKAGIYLVFGISKMGKELIYIGSSGHITNNGLIHVRSSGGGGIKGRIVNGHHFNRERRFICWPKQMINEEIEQLEVSWYVTHNEDFIDSPCYAEHCLLQLYYNRKKRLPRWNQKF